MKSKPNNQDFSFAIRHLGVYGENEKMMLETIGVKDLDTLIDETIPSNIRRHDVLAVPEPLSEMELQEHFNDLAAKNSNFKSYIGQGYYSSFTPPVIARNIFHNPGWYTQYTPYQAEIAQGRLEALLNFQTMVSDLTGLPIANASLLDEATSASEAMTLMYAVKNKRIKGDPINKIFVDQHVFQSTIDVLQTRAEPLGIKLHVGDWKEVSLNGEDYFGAILQYPNTNGQIEDYRAFATELDSKSIMLTVCADILSLALIEAPGNWGADIAVGTTQRLGIPIGNGGPHAAYFAIKEKYKRIIPGRIIGVSEDRLGQPALRMALQTREQHIKREKATSNICTAQALLAIMAGMYGVFHGNEGLTNIALEIHKKSSALYDTLKANGYECIGDSFFDTIRVKCGDVEKIRTAALANKINFFYDGDCIQISIDECTTQKEVNDIANIFGCKIDDATTSGSKINESMLRTSEFMTHPVFSEYRTESQMMRYIKRLENKDLSLVHSMIPLGSCTMKLNAASELMPITNPAFANVHPLVPADQVEGYMEILNGLSDYLNSITGFDACSLQPNSGAQGEYAGLLTIRNFFKDTGQENRNIALIPSSAHGTNPASAVMAGMKVVVTACDEKGNIDLDDLKAKAEEHKDNLACLMVTYPSTHGVFETEIKEICQIIHNNGGKVYMDGANMNAQVGLTSPAHIGTDVCHLNLHKTFSIPHGGGGPGMGPICCTSELAPYLPGHETTSTEKSGPVSQANFGSASILLISYSYIRLLGHEGMTQSTKIAILNANYIKARLESEFQVLYTGEKGRAAHEMIIDMRAFKALGVSAEDVAKRLIDYGFHAPTLSFPVAGTLMIEPTESEDKDEIDRFCDAMLSIKKEIDEIALGKADQENNVLSNAPHTLMMVSGNDWDYPYSREKAAYPLPYLRTRFKFWPSVARIDNAKGDRNLICTCPDISTYEEKPKMTSNNV